MCQKALSLAIKNSSRCSLGGSRNHFSLQHFNFRCSSKTFEPNSRPVNQLNAFFAHGYSISSYERVGTAIRPTISPKPNKPVSMTQSFRTSVPVQASHDNTTIDFCFLPSLSDLSPTPHSGLRVPLLPDNYTPNRTLNSTHISDTLDTALPRPEINIVASHPEYALPATIGETDSNDGLDLSLAGLIATYDNQPSEIPEESVLKSLWHGVVNDVVEPKPSLNAGA